MGCTDDTTLGSMAAPLDNDEDDVGCEELAGVGGAVKAIPTTPAGGIPKFVPFVGV